MLLNIEVAPAVFESMKKQAAKSGLSVEQIAGAQLEEKFGEKATHARGIRWGKDGVPWSELPPEEVALAYEQAYKNFPIAEDEFAVHPDDIAAFEKFEW